MHRRIVNRLLVIVLMGPTVVFGLEGDTTEKTFEVSNSAYHLIVMDCGTQIRVRLYDKTMDFVWCDAPYFYHASRSTDSGTVCYESLESLSISRQDNSIRIQAILAGLELNHIFELPRDKPIMEERLLLRNCSDSLIKITDFEAGLQRRVTDKAGNVLMEFTDDRLVAIPFRRRATDPKDHYNDFSISEFLARASNESRRDDNFIFVRIPARHQPSEGWAWTHGDNTLGIFKFSQENMQFSVISKRTTPEGICLRFGGACMLSGEPSALSRIQPGQSVDLGLMRYQTVKGNYVRALYAFRHMLDEKGCHFPDDYDPPIHWNELYDNPELGGLTSAGNPAIPRLSMRVYTYTKALMEKEAAKAKDYSCQALYLDPGWDTKFGSFVWGHQWLGPRKQFIKDIKSKYGLDVSLHCPLATWMSIEYIAEGGRGPEDGFPEESFRMDANGNITKNAVCLGSKQYLEIAAKRLVECCADGVVFLMFDGNWWAGECWNPDHGHPIPYRIEDHIQANLELAQRIHARYPDVLIEMHDMIAGGRRNRVTPVYYKYGLEGSYDENWGFELMWDPYRDLVWDGRALALYYYNMGCNIPLYLHIDLSTDNEHCLVLWWYASTCRHLGIGGAHPNHSIAEAQKAAMKRYRSLERFYKRGQFLGINEEVHLHILPEENAFVVNVFNLSDERRMVKGYISAKRLGIDLDRWYIRDGRSGRFNKKEGLFSVRCTLPPWSTELAVFRACP